MTKYILPSLPDKITRSIDLIVIHCSGTANGKKISTPNKTAAQVIDDWHRQRNFKRSPAAIQKYNQDLTSIGYHYVIDLDGSIQLGRHLDEVGAHAKNFNARSIGICLIGGREREGSYTPNQWKALAYLTMVLAKKFNIPLNPPQRLSNTSIKNGICGHRDLSPDLNRDGKITPNEWTKTCPGFDVAEFLSKLYIEYTKIVELI